MITKFVQEELDVEWIRSGDDETSRRMPSPQVTDLRRIEVVDGFEHINLKMGDMVHFRDTHFPELLRREGLVEAVEVASTSSSPEQSSGSRKRKNRGPKPPLQSASSVSPPRFTLDTAVVCL